MPFNKTNITFNYPKGINHSIKNTSNFRFYSNQLRNHPSLIHTVLSPLANQFISHLSLNEKKPFGSNVLMLYMQDIQGTTSDMFELMHELGLRSAIGSGKLYSTHQGSVERLRNRGFKYLTEAHPLGYALFNESTRATTNYIWEKALKEIEKRQRYELVIVLDNGADLLMSTKASLFEENMHKKKPSVIGIEQSKGGYSQSLLQCLPFPVINVAGSYVENLIKCPWVAKTIASKIDKLVEQILLDNRFIQKPPTIGVIGYGNMGKALTEIFLTNYNVIVYDKNNLLRPLDPKLKWYPNLPQLIHNADIIIGCTGEDVTASKEVLQAFLYSMHPKHLISASSKDIEFKGLLGVIQKTTKQLYKRPNPFENIIYRNQESGIIKIERGGFPINFDNSEHSIPPERIWVTSACLLLASLMCLRLANSPLLQNSANILKLDPQGQLLILRKYQEIYPDDNCLKPIEGLNDEDLLDYIIRNSEGESIIQNEQLHKKIEIIKPDNTNSDFETKNISFDFS